MVPIQPSLKEEVSVAYGGEQVDGSAGVGGRAGRFSEPESTSPNYSVWMGLRVIII